MYKWYKIHSICAFFFFFFLVFVLLWLAYFTEYNVLKIHPHRRMCQNVLPLEAKSYSVAWTDCIFLPTHPLMDTWAASPSQLLWIMVHEHGSAGFSLRPWFSSFGCIPRRRIAGSCDGSIFNFLRKHTVFWLEPESASSVLGLWDFNIDKSLDLTIQQCVRATQMSQWEMWC